MQEGSRISSDFIHVDGDYLFMVFAFCLLALGHPARNAMKFFATQDLEQLWCDEKWLARASDAICQYCANETPATEVASVERMETIGSTDGLPKWADSPTNATATG
jgi:hypothetical protein